jgi:hypothetical protein
MLVYITTFFRFGQQNCRLILKKIILDTLLAIRHASFGKTGNTITRENLPVKISAN